MSETKPTVKNPKKEEDQAEIQRVKDRAKYRFRAVVRRVIDNNYWLSESVDEYEGDDVKRRVEQAIRRNNKKKQLLNINDKALLNKPAEERTEQEKKYLYRIIGGLKCFRRYPDHVKRQLAAVTYFKYYGPDRVIVRQNQEAYATYFIVTGDINISVLIYDEYLKKHVSTVVGQMHPGDMFGEVSLLHNIKRTATCTTLGHCEFLALMREDFKNVLLVSLQKQWDQIRLAMSSFSYFSSYDEVALREGCIVAKMKSFSRNETIMGDGRGTPNFVYFVLSGRCQMIETLEINVTTNVQGKKFYSLYDPFVNIPDNEIDFDERCLTHAMKKRRQQVQPSNDEPLKSTPTSYHVKKQSTVSIPKSSRQQSTVSIPKSSRKQSTVSISKSSRTSKLSKKDTDPNCDDVLNVTERKSSSKLSTPCTSKQENQHRTVEGNIEETKQTNENHPRIISQGPRVSIKNEVTPNSKEDPNKKLPKASSVKRTIFMQVCEFLPGATFGLGENMRDRRIIALTDVDCMLLPYMWLMQRNTFNIWSRVKHYLDKKIPTKQKLFEEFVSDRRWHGSCEQMLQEFGYTSLIEQGKDNKTNMTTISDVPYSIRVEEMIDL